MTEDIGQPATAPIIVSALFGPADQQALDALRHQHFPPERNHLPAHLTLFHHLPPSIEAELRQRLATATHTTRPPAQLTAVRNLGRGVAFSVASEGLQAIRADLADAFQMLLTPQDAAAWRPHVTIQNKVRPEEARALHGALSQDFRPRALVIKALAAWWYRGGPWELIAAYAFR